jgi:hypothetical protein
MYLFGTSLFGRCCPFDRPSRPIVSQEEKKFMKLRTTALAVALMASVSCLAVSAQAAPFGGWHGGVGGWHGGGWHGGRWHGGGWAGAGLGFAAGAIIGSALATASYDGGYYAAGYGYPDYGYADAPVVYGYQYAPVDSSYDYEVAPSYSYAYGPAYTGYSVAEEPAWDYGQRRYRYGYEQRYGYESYGRGGTYVSYGTAMRRQPSSSVRGEYRTGAIPSESRRPLYAHYQGRGDHPTTGTGVSRMNTGAGVSHSNSGAGEMDRGRRQ